MMKLISWLAGWHLRRLEERALAGPWDPGLSLAIDRAWWILEAARHGS